jgi:hypothetical protein
MATVVTVVQFSKDFAQITVRRQVGNPQQALNLLEKLERGGNPKDDHVQQVRTVRWSPPANSVHALIALR